MTCHEESARPYTYNGCTSGFQNLLLILLHLLQAMSGSQNSNTYTCTCTHFCGGYKTGLSQDTFYRHAPYQDAVLGQPSYSSSFQDFLDNSAGESGASNLSGTGQESSQAQGNADNFGAEFLLDGGTQNSGSTVNIEATVVNFPYQLINVSLKQSWALGA